MTDQRGLFQLTGIISPTLFIALMSGVLAPCSAADTLHLKNGTVLSGKIIQQGKNELIFEIPGTGPRAVPYNDIAHIGATSIGYQDEIMKSMTPQKAQALAYAAVGEYSQAIHVLERSVDTTMNDVGAVVLLAQLYEEQDASDRAIRMVQKAVELDANHPLWHAKLSTLYLRDGKPAQALAEWKRATELDSSPLMVYSLFKFYLEVGDFAQAEASLAEASRMAAEEGDMVVAEGAAEQLQMLRRLRVALPPEQFWREVRRTLAKDRADDLTPFGHPRAAQPATGPATKAESPEESTVMTATDTVKGVDAMHVSPVKEAEVEALTKKIRELYERGAYDAALEIAEKALKLSETSLEPTHPLRAAALTNLASLYPRARGVRQGRAAL